MMKSENYIVIQGWMRTELGLKGNDLLVYAIIYGFTQAESQRFTGSLGYLAEWCGATKQGIIGNLKKLLERGLIQREDRYINGVKYVEYYSTEFTTPLNSVYHPVQLSLPNNKEDTIKDTIGNIYTADSTQFNDQKHKYGEYSHVLLTDKERDKLFDRYGEHLTTSAIRYLDEYIERKGYKAKSHYLTIIKWVVDAVQKEEGGRLDWLDNAL